MPLDFCLVRKSVVEECGGLDAALFPDLFAGADLGLRLREQGYSNIYTPYCAADWSMAGLKMREKNMHAQWQEEKSAFQAQWRQILTGGNPLYNPGCYRQQGIGVEAFQNWFVGV